LKGKARQGNARHGKERQGMERQGMAWKVRERKEKARNIDDFRCEISLMGEIRGYKILVGQIISIEGYKRI
jgi:hypothetical protein